jgi:hypothetical protein
MVFFDVDKVTFPKVNDKDLEPLDGFFSFVHRCQSKYRFYLLLARVVFMFYSSIVLLADAHIDDSFYALTSLFSLFSMTLTFIEKESAFW